MSVRSITAAAGAVWGVAGVTGVLLRAVVALYPVALEGLSGELGWIHWSVLALWMPFMLWSEGYRGFHASFSPLIVARALYLKRHPTLWRVLLAPIYCMGFFGATRRRRIVAVSLPLAIIGLVLLVRLLPQPWRGIVDAGVVAGLACGIASIGYFSWRALRSGSLDRSPEVVQPAGTADAPVYDGPVPAGLSTDHDGQ